jgi:hypothetical protein
VQKNDFLFLFLFFRLGFLGCFLKEKKGLGPSRVNKKCYYLTGFVFSCLALLKLLCWSKTSLMVSGEKFEPTTQNPNFSTNNRLSIEIIQLFIDFLLEIENFIENRSAIIIPR